MNENSEQYEEGPSGWSRAELLREGAREATFRRKLKNGERLGTVEADYFVQLVDDLRDYIRMKEAVPRGRKFSAAPTSLYPVEEEPRKHRWLRHLLPTVGKFLSTRRRHSTVPLWNGYRWIPVDEEIAGLILNIWTVGLRTENACQDQHGSGKVWIAFSSAGDLNEFLDIVRRYYPGRCVDEMFSDLGSSISSYGRLKRRLRKLRGLWHLEYDSRAWTYYLHPVPANQLEESWTRTELVTSDESKSARQLYEEYERVWQENRVGLVSVVKFKRRYLPHVVEAMRAAVEHGGYIPIRQTPHKKEGGGQ